MINKEVSTCAEAVAGISDGAIVLVAGFGAIGVADHLLDALHDQGAKELTVVANNAGTGDYGLAKLIDSGRVRKVICSYPRSSPVSAGTKLAEGKETREIGGRLHVFESPLKGDVAFIKARTADRWGNLAYAKSARNFNPVMATAADLTVVEVDTMVELGEMDPEAIVTPSIFVDRVVVIGEGAWSS